ncbi:3-methyl-2-oxobutanoate hydroxymethyltransferase [Azospirillum griseum]|uniref:3-methyl-2-oxobutanoate hydroxymethyltransferase n=1 Tax=Azospirillum griseum TaxID=2496639 RepID=A0A431VCE9_9PROT|nr:3-methyl-2-oxobutanoate hydroxymethyltransferase [Azospirillum griseum]RTR16611.1 3-methyl-2-oxobutanoate hydroxymethyltransferase [Azospirillum griseum]
MSASKSITRLSTPDLRARKGAEPIVCLTAYTAPMARLLDQHVDLLLVGDSLGMVVYGLDSTLPVSLDMMIAHGAAVVRASEQACVVVDLPFGCYQESPQAAFRASARVMQETGAQAVKLEGGLEMAETVAFLTARGIPVMGHVGLTPQSVNTLGGYKALGRDPAVAERIVADARAIAQAGAFSVVLEAVMEPLARRITEEIAIPTIGIGGSPACDGQVLVTDDMLGLFGQFQPKFVKRYAEMADTVTQAVASYAAEVRTRRFPGPEHCFGIKKPTTTDA